MIVSPKRSVTRFFIPLIDVLILLFCIFLLMPFVSSPEDAVPPAVVKNEDLPKDLVILQKQLAETKKRLDRVLKDKTPTADKLAVRVLEIDGNTGRLFSFEPESRESRQEVKDQFDAQKLIDKQRRIAGAKEPFFLILYPRELTGFPLQKQVDTYRRWFANVSHGFDNPWGG